MKILLTTDGSTYAEHAIRWFSRLPICRTSDLTIVTVAAHPAASIYWGGRDEELSRLETANALEAYQRATMVLAEVGCVATHAPQIGHAADEIVRYAEEYNADLIVVGAKGHSMLTKILLGSTTDFVSTHAPCSVLVVRHPEASLAQDLQSLRVTLAHDGSPSAIETAKQIQSIPWPTNAELSLITVIQRPALLAEDIPYDLYLTEAMKKLLDDARVELEPKFASTTREVLEEIHIGGSIVNFAKKNKTDIVFVGDAGHSAISRFFIGSTSKFVLQHAECSVWITRAKRSFL